MRFKNDFDIRKIAKWMGSSDISCLFRDEYKLVSKKWKASQLPWDLGDNVFVKMAEWRSSTGPLLHRMREQSQSGKHCVRNDINLMRGGVVLKHGVLYAFRGLGLEGLKALV